MASVYSGNIIRRFGINMSFSPDGETGAITQLVPTPANVKAVFVDSPGPIGNTGIPGDYALNMKTTIELPFSPDEVKFSHQLIEARQNKWDLRFIEMSRLVSTWSKDPSTKVGAVIVRPNGSIASVGFNGFPQKMTCCDHQYENREEKYSRIIHGEINALTFCTDESLNGYTLYTTPFMPCDRCFVQMVQVGITRFVAPKATPDQLTRWGVAFERVRKYAVECNVQLVEIDNG
jgi:dCMP deaminase